MKKFISAAALFAASTALASAVTLDDAILSLVGSEIQSTNTITGATSTSFSFTFTISDVASTFDMIGKAPSLSSGITKTFVSVEGGTNHVVGTAIGYNSSNNVIQKVGIYSVLTPASSDHLSSGSCYAGAAELAATTGDGVYAVSEVSFVAVTVVHTAASGTDVYTTLSLNDGSTVAFTNNSTGQKWSSGNQVPAELLVNTTGPDISSVYFFDSALSATDAASVNSLAIAAISVPEPSAFGLLAGVGALALVAARRRRSRAK